MAAQPQQAKMMNDMEKRLNVLFDMLNCEALPQPALGRVIEIVKGESSFPPPSSRLGRRKSSHF